MALSVAFPSWYIIIIDSKLHKKALKNVVTYKLCLRFLVTQAILSAVIWLKVPALSLNSEKCAECSQCIITA